jgi:hypothetical protein
MESSFFLPARRQTPCRPRTALEFPAYRRGIQDQVERAGQGSFGAHNLLNSNCLDR